MEQQCQYLSISPANASPLHTSRNIVVLPSSFHSLVPIPTNAAARPRNVKCNITASPFQNRGYLKHMLRVDAVGQEADGHPSPVADLVLEEEAVAVGCLPLLPPSS